MTINPTTLDRGTDRFANLERKLDLLTTQMGYLVERQRNMEELLDYMQPILKIGMDDAIEKLQKLEDAGYFAFGAELLSVLDRVVTAYSVDDVKRLGDQVVGILDTVRNVTQPDMLAMVNDVAGAVHDADDADPKGMWGMMRAGKDPEVRKGMGVLVAILKQVGRAADKVGHTDAPPVRLPVYQAEDGKPKAGWIRHLAPSRRLPPPAAPSRPAPAASAPARQPAPAAPQAATNMPEGYDAACFLTDPHAWTRELAQAAATALGYGTLTDEHWTALEWARSDYFEAGASPNVRRLAKGSGLEIRQLYALFPGKPGVRVAQIAGIPKPGGCL